MIHLHGEGEQVAPAACWSVVDLHLSPYSGQPTPHHPYIFFNRTKAPRGFLFARFRFGLHNIQVIPPTVSRGLKVAIN